MQNASKMQFFARVYAPFHFLRVHLGRVGHVQVVNRLIRAMRRVVKVDNWHVAGVATPTVVAIVGLGSKKKAKEIIKTAPCGSVLLREVAQVCPNNVIVAIGLMLILIRRCSFPMA